MGKFIDTFGGRALLSGLFNLILIGIFSMFVTKANYTIDQGILYASLISLVVWCAAEFVIAKVKNRRPIISMYCGAAILGTLVVAMAICLILYACHIIV